MVLDVGIGCGGAPKIITGGAPKRGAPLTATVIGWLPAFLLVTFTVHVPLASVVQVVELSVTPAGGVKVITAPATGLPFASNAVAVRMFFEVPSAGFPLIVTSTLLLAPVAGPATNVATGGRLKEGCR